MTEETSSSRGTGRSRKSQDGPELTRQRSERLGSEEIQKAPRKQRRAGQKEESSTLCMDTQAH